MANFWTVVPSPTNASRFEGIIHERTIGILPPGLQPSEGSAFDGAAHPTFTTPITQPGFLLDNRNLFWELGSLQGMQPAPRGLEYGTAIPEHDRGASDAQSRSISTPFPRAAIPVSPPSRNLVQRSSARRPSFHPYSHGRASLPHAGSQHTPPTTSRDMSHSVDPVETFFGHQAIPGGPQDTQALDAAVNSPLSVAASEAGAFLQVTPLDFPGVADLAVTAELAVTTEATHGALLPLQRTTSLSSSGCLDSVLVQDMLLSAAGHFPYEGDVGLNQTKENCINVAGTVESGTGRDKVNTSAAFEAILSIPGSPQDPSPTPAGEQATLGTPTTLATPSAQPSSPGEGQPSPDHHKSRPQAGRGAKRQNRKPATQLQNIFAELDPSAYSRAQLLQKGLAIDENEELCKQVIRAHVGIDLSRCPPYYVPVEITLWPSLIELSKSGERINMPTVKALGAAFKGKHLTTNGNSTFNCSGSWIDAFRKRHAINWNGEIDISQSGAPEGAMLGWVNFVRENHPDLLKP